jgi:hypothetical protein
MAWPDPDTNMVWRWLRADTDYQHGCQTDIWGLCAHNSAHHVLRRQSVTTPLALKGTPSGVWRLVRSQLDFEDGVVREMWVYADSLAGVAGTAASDAAAGPSRPGAPTPDRSPCARRRDAASQDSASQDTLVLGGSITVMFHNSLDFRCALNKCCPGLSLSGCEDGT